MAYLYQYFNYTYTIILVVFVSLISIESISTQSQTNPVQYALAQSSLSSTNNSLLNDNLEKKIIFVLIEI